jgi:hypothetical protein
LLIFGVCNVDEGKCWHRKVGLLKYTSSLRRYSVHSTLKMERFECYSYCYYHDPFLILDCVMFCFKIFSILSLCCVHMRRPEFLSSYYCIALLRREDLCSPMHKGHSWRRYKSIIRDGLIIHSYHCLHFRLTLQLRHASFPPL